MLFSLIPVAPLSLSPELAADLPSYRCRTRAYQDACNMDTALDSIIQLKAPNAIEALRLARLVTPEGCAVVEVERLDG